MTPPYLVEFLSAGSTCNLRLSTGVDEVCGAPRCVLARRVVVELDPDVVEEPRLKGFAYPLVREWTLGRCRQVHLLAGAVGLEVRCKFSVVVWISSLNVEVDAVEHGIAQGPLVGVATEEVVPDVLGELEGVLLGVEGVASCAAADGEHDLDTLGLAEGDVGGEVGAGVGVGVAVACKVELRGRLRRAEAAEEGDVDKGVVAGGAGLGQGALVAILAPVDGNVAAAMALARG